VPIPGFLAEPGYYINGRRLQNLSRGPPVTVPFAKPSGSITTLGMCYTLRLFKGVDANTMRTAMAQVAASLGGSIRWGQAGTGDQDLRLDCQRDVHTVYLPCQAIDFTFCEEVGRRLGVPWIELRIQEGSLWDYAVYRGAECLDTFSVCPQYWDGGEADAETLEQWRGKPEILAAAWGLPVERIRNYLVNWGYRADKVEGIFEHQLRGKAYASDEYEYGDYEQFFDVLKALGGHEPLERHTIVLRQPAGG
jgi:hypothetical protein